MEKKILANQNQWGMTTIKDGSERKTWSSDVSAYISNDLKTALVTRRYLLILNGEDEEIGKCFIEDGLADTL